MVDPISFPREAKVLVLRIAELEALVREIKTTWLDPDAVPASLMDSIDSLLEGATKP